MIGLNSGKLRNRRETADPEMLQGTVKELISPSDLIKSAKLDFPYDLSSYKTQNSFFRILKNVAEMDGHRHKSGHEISDADLDTRVRPSLRRSKVNMNTIMPLGYH